MPVKRDQRTSRWFFRTIVNYPDGTSQRVFGTPGVPGPYQDLANTKVGAEKAEQRAKHEAISGKPVIVDERATSVLIKEDKTKKTIREHAVNFVELYKPGSKPSEKRTRRCPVDC